jgi:SAM-dependent methyltransferase
VKALLLLKPYLRRLPGYARLRLLYRLTLSPQERSEAWLILSSKPDTFQPYATTSANRYPEFFTFVRDALGDAPDIRLLSFGCSTGEEAFSLRRLFPQADITGIDINPYNIKVANSRRLDDDRMRFICRGSVEEEASASYDAIFAMAVFRHGDLNDGPISCRHRIRFADFNRHATELARVLKPGGFLAFCHANFRFSDPTAGAGFMPARMIGAGGKKQHYYGPGDHLLVDARREDGIFRKRLSDHSSLDV